MNSGNPYHPGCLEVITGAMFTSKTLLLLVRVDQAYHFHIPYQAFKPQIDKRWEENKIISRFMGEYIGIDATVIDENNPSQLLEKLDPEARIIAIDEVMFFNPKIANIITYLVKQGKNVIVTGLDLDFRGEPFGIMPTLEALADHVTKTKGACTYEVQGVTCDKVGTRTLKTINGQPSPYDEDIVEVGDKQYQLVCLDHHIVPGKPRLKN